MSRRRHRHAIEKGVDSILRTVEDPRWKARYKRKRKRFARIVKAILAIVIVTFVLVPIMIASGFLLGPNGSEGLIAAPLVLFASWAAILYWAMPRRTTPQAIAKADVKQLPAQTETWIEQERGRLPLEAQQRLDGIATALEAMSPQLQTLDAQAPGALEVRRLLSEELPELVRGYRKVPRALAQQPLYGGATPERQLVEGLETIEKQIARVHERLAADDMHALATHQRYLDLKYNRKDEIE